MSKFMLIGSLMLLTIIIAMQMMTINNQDEILEKCSGITYIYDTGIEDKSIGFND